MFRSSTSRIVDRLAEAIDDMLIGDYDYVFDGGRVYADVDYVRRCSERDSRPAASVPRRGPVGIHCARSGQRIA
jgi:hypothetical protein